MFTKYENGAEVDIEEVYRYENGAEVEAEAVYAYKDGAEVEVWSANEELQWLLQNNNRDYDVDLSNDDTAIKVQVDAGAEEYLYLLTLIDKPYENPTIAFEWYGGGYTGSKYVSAGTVYVVGIDENGEEIVKSCGTLGSSTDDTGDTESMTLSGTFEQVGIKVMFKDSSSYDSYYMAYVNISNITIDGEKCVIS